MPAANEILVFVIAIFAIWFLLKLARFAIRVILFFITVAVIVGLVWHFFLR